jgi:alpha-N-arabinofuranosidase
VHPRGIVKRTTFHVLRMYSDLLLPNVVESRITSPPLHIDQKTVQALDAVTTCSDDRRQTAIALVNRHPEAPARWKLGLTNAGSQENARVTILSGDSPDAYNDVAHPERVVPAQRPWNSRDAYLELPPHSVAIVQMTL